VRRSHAGVSEMAPPEPLLDLSIPRFSIHDATQRSRRNPPVEHRLAPKAATERPKSLCRSACTREPDPGRRDSPFPTALTVAAHDVVASQPVRRILFGPESVVAIHLGRRSPDGSCGLPGGQQAGRPPPVRPCSRWGLPSRPGRPERWCALTAPFHPCLYAGPGGPPPSAVCSLLHCPAGRPDWVLPSTVPCGVRTFLEPVVPVRGHPADSLPLTSLRRVAAGARGGT